MSEIVFMVEQTPEGGYTARALGELIFTESDTIGVLRTQVQDAVRCHFDEGQSPKIIRLQLHDANDAGAPMCRAGPIE